MQTLTEIKAMLEARGLRPRHRFGQNFLHDHNQLRKLVEAAGVRPGDVVLEVGPGTGTLTEALLEARAGVIACEIDRDLSSLMRGRFNERIALIEEDCLDGKHSINPAIVSAIDGRRFKLVSNLPYGAATPLIVNFLIDHPNCDGMFVTIQKEVADRLLAKPSTKDYGPLSIVAQAFSRIEMIGVVPPSCFWPQPEVTSAMVALFPCAPGKGAGDEGSVEGSQSPVVGDRFDRRAFAKFVTGLFSKRRKQLGAILRRDGDWPPGIAPTMRPEELAMDQVALLFELDRASDPARDRRASG